jgi:hypothetical protein
MKKLNMLVMALSVACIANAQWATNGNDIYSTNTGNVGIGTSTPAVKLDVKGNINTSGITLSESWDNVLSSYDNGNAFQLIGTYRGWDSKAIYIAGYNARNAAATGTNMVTERVYIGNPNTDGTYLSVNLLNGSVGIGTTATGSFRLAVEGSIGAREVRVTNTNPWPDYVFSRNYKLPDLANVEKYIKKNSHLPNLPSASEVKENGIDLGQMNAKLVEKIEELTLYVIDLKKETKQLKKENVQLRAMIQKRK